MCVRNVYGYWCVPCNRNRGTHYGKKIEKCSACGKFIAWQKIGEVRQQWGDDLYYAHSKYGSLELRINRLLGKKLSGYISVQAAEARVKQSWI